MTLARGQKAFQFLTRSLCLGRRSNLTRNGVWKLIFALGAETGHTGTKQGAKVILLGGLLKGKKLLRKRGRQQGCGGQGRKEDGGPCMVQAPFLFPSQFGLRLCICSL